MREVRGRIECTAGAIELHPAGAGDVEPILQVQRDAAELPRSKGYRMCSMKGRFTITQN